MSRPSRITRRWLHGHPLPAINSTSDKEDRGQALVVAGSTTVPGAATLAGTAALRVGCGKLVIAAERSAVAAIAHAVPEAAIYSFNFRSKRQALLFDEAIEKSNAILIGPGLPSDREVVKLVRYIATRTRVPIVLDAGALEVLRTAQVSRPARLVCTPHHGEMARLIGWSKRRISENPIAAAEQFARSHTGCLVLKSDCTLVMHESTLLVHKHGHPGLGTSGSGDVLAGGLVGLLARGLPPVVAAGWAVYAHALAGRRLAKRIAPVGYLAREVADELPRCLTKPVSP